MTNLDLLLLAVYFIVVFRVLYEAFKSLDDKFSVSVDQGLLDQELQDKHFGDISLKTSVNLKFNFDPRYKLGDLKKFSINIENKTQDRSLYVDWDSSSLTDLGGRSRRVIRIPPNMTIDLFQAQASSVIAPGQTLRESITAEDLLKPKSDDAGVLEISASDPLVNIKKLDDKKSPEKDKARYAKFMSEEDTLDFSLRLALCSAAPHSGMVGQTVYILCKFVLKKLPWTDAFPWNQQKR
ncbi:hypothetical protein BST81_17955 [Leptolyngbya sp. 'hensonii']|uniref:hypothetical protein n=1 Tax=Leptolyngbya sp. 'hensonii' TaxID=1922337 RepID=UPI00094F9DC0|nr:hypothetical protein [Leptolyngbya sp. 'hensonii']OLP17226.1 hypothetical protein BST81_17955 [Leptolyngbya sp. 'hensonii']